MPGAVISTALNVGFPGSIVTSSVYSVASRSVRATDTFGPSFGDPVVLHSDGTYSSVAAFIQSGGTFTGSLFGGFAVRNVKSTETYITNYNDADAAEWGFFDTGTLADVITFGSVVVLVHLTFVPGTGTTTPTGYPTLNGPLYVRVALNGSYPSGVVGGIEAVPDGSNTVQLPANVRFTKGYLDDNSCIVVTLMAGAGETV